jgi:hypothetical protein
MVLDNSSVFENIDPVSWTSVVLLCAGFWLWRLQKEFGPRICLSKFLKKETAHEYFVSLSELKDVHENDICSICYAEFKHAVKFDQELQMEDLSDSVYAQLNKNGDLIMRTPCNHHFHISCLVTVMNYRQSCPLCRVTLPNIEH